MPTWPAWHGMDVPTLSFDKAVVNKLLSEQVDAILILPKFMRYWVPMLQQLPVLDGHECSWFGGMYSNGSRAPNDMKDSHPQYVLTAFLVRL